MRAYSEYRWNADIRGVRVDADAGGLVTDLPLVSFGTDRPGLAYKYPTAAHLTERQENDLCEAGFLPLVNCQYTPYCAFFGNGSVQRPQSFDTQVATINARMSAMIQYVLCVSRFAHYIKVMARDWVGSFTSPDDCERRLWQWLVRYCTANEDASYEFKAQYPLREASVSVREMPGAPGLYSATIHLKPHFQLDQIVSSFKLVTTLPGKTAA
jgi:type VI secretion system ImpC/EvpB family protein